MSNPVRPEPLSGIIYRGDHPVGSIQLPEAEAEFIRQFHAIYHSLGLEIRLAQLDAPTRQKAPLAQDEPTRSQN